MLRPSDTATRERKSLVGLWHFRLDGDGEGRSARWFDGPLPDAGEMAVPASFNDIAPDAAVHDYVGDVWYQTTVRVPRGWDGRRVVLYVESATHRATVWVNGTEVVSHEGGYLPFEADVTEHVRAGRGGTGHRRGEQHAELPDHPAGRHRGHPRGQAATVLARLLQLRGPPPPGLAVLDRPGASHRHHRRDRAGRPEWPDRVRGRRPSDADGVDVRVVLRDAEGTEVARGAGASGTLRVPDVHRWASGRRLPLRPGGAARRRGDELLDSYHQPVGCAPWPWTGSRVPRQR